MLRSLRALLATLFLVLLSVVVYALSGLSGPEIDLAEAESHYLAEDFDAALQSLNQAARSASLRSDPDMRQRLLDLRYRVYRQQGNDRVALVDLENLIRTIGGERPDLLLNRIDLLISNHRPEEGLERARRFLMDNPASGRANELAGEACQVLYQQDLDGLFQSLRLNLDPEVRRRALRAMEDYLYRPAGDPEVMGGLSRYHEIMDHRLLGRDREDTADRVLLEVRQRIQQALAYLRLGLELSSEPVEAFNGFARILDRGGRRDDLFALAEIYLRRFDHLNTVQAANHLAHGHLDAGRWRAAVEVADRFLPAGTWEERRARGQLSDEIRHLLLAQARALYALGDQSRLHQVATVADAMRAAGVPLALEHHKLAVLGFQIDGRLMDAEGHLAILCTAAAQRPPPGEGPDPLRESMGLRITAARERGAPPAEVRAMFERWVASRRSDPVPYLAYARYSVDTGDWPEAFTHAKRAYELSAQDEEALLVLARAADGFYGRSGRDSRSLLTQCLALETETPPDLRHRILLLPLAELAMEQGHALVALACAEAASQQYVWSRWPRMLGARAARLPGRPGLAVEHLESLLEYNPFDRAALLELHRARVAAGRPTEDLLADLVRSSGPRNPAPETVAGLLGEALARGDGITAGQIAARVKGARAGNPELLELLVETWALTGETHRTREALQQLLAVAPAGSLQRAKAMASAFLLRVGDGPGEVVQPEAVQQELEQLALTLSAHADLLGDVARKLAEMGRTRSAYRLLQELMEQERHRGERGGALFGLAGRLALGLGLQERAVEHLAAAASFEGGADAIVPLALTLLKLGRQDEARPWIGEIAVVDSITAALARGGGRSAAALPWIRATLGQWPWHPEANCLAALSTTDDPAWEGLKDLVASSRTELLEVLTFLGAEGFASHALELARSLRDANPANFPAELLHLRALGQAGRSQEALEIVEGLRAIHGDRMEILNEAARLVLGTASLSAPLGEALIEAVLHALPESSPAMVVAALRGMAGPAAPRGGMESALDRVGELWRRAPGSPGAGLGEAEFPLHYQHPAAALRLLTWLEPTVARADRRGFWESWFGVAQFLAWEAGDRDLGEVARARARRVVSEEAAYGSAVDFLLGDQLRRLAAGELTADELRREARELVHGHLQFFRAGGDPNPRFLLASLARVEDLDGGDAALRETETLLAAHPSLMGVWRLRAELLERAGRPRQAVAELRSLLAHVRDRDLVWTLARIAGQEGVSTPGDQALVQEAYGDDVSSPRVRLVRGLLALRAGRYGEADSLLDGSSPRPDGAHLYYRALANLPLPGEESGRRAAQLFGELLERYPDSPLALNAGSFLRQLSL